MKKLLLTLIIIFPPLTAGWGDTVPREKTREKPLMSLTVNSALFIKGVQAHCDSEGCEKPVRYVALLPEGNHHCLDCRCEEHGK